ncbi:MAG TPA: M20/M25/M40 family metallo-hydrolase [Terriglobales bacterium]|nr:M20/M25/M40 family metallo-hydrolase [Terriglobales bacterium]
MFEDKLFQFTRQLMDLDSTSGCEGEAGQFVAAYLRSLGGLEVELWEVEPQRFNVFAHRGRPEVVLSTHLDTVPPFIASSEDDRAIYGRGACDAKGICAAQIFAAQRLLAKGVENFGLLYVVGEEKNSAGANFANARPQGSRFLVNGEPTDSRMIRAGKGVLRVNLNARGRAAHSAYPDLGDSAIDKLLDALARVRALPLPSHPDLGPATLNIGVISGGRAPNVIADRAQAEIMFRLVEDAGALRNQVCAAVGAAVETEFVLELPPLHCHTLDGFPTGIVAFGTDIPKLTAWGTPLLFGPGSIHAAHTTHEFIPKSELAAAVGAYAAIVTRLLAGCD